MVKIGNFWYFFFIIFTVGLILGLYFLFKNKSLKSKKILIGSLLLLNLAVHFLKLLIPPYSTNKDFAIENVWFINICAVSVFSFPIIFFSKSKTLKDWIFYIGCISGGLALLYPTEAIETSILEPDLWRFYVCHIIILIAPLLMVLLKVHTLNYRNIWKMPFCMAGVLLFIMCNQVLQSELGIISMRVNNLLEEGCGYRNTSLIWGPTDGIAAIFTWLTPDFMKTVPFGELAGQEKYWPFFYLLPGCFLYFIVFPFLICLPWELKHVKDDFKKIVNFVKTLKTKFIKQK